MKALTLTQPWATLVAIGAKRIETRSWSTSYRGPIAIHAAKKFPADARCLCPSGPFSEALGMETLHTGKIVAVAELTECFRFTASSEAHVRRRSAVVFNPAIVTTEAQELMALPPFEADFGDYTAGRYGFVFRHVRRLTTPITARGMLSLWDVPPDVFALICEQTDESAREVHA